MDKVICRGCFATQYKTSKTEEEAVANNLFESSIKKPQESIAKENEDLEFSRNGLVFRIAVHFKYHKCLGDQSL